VLDIQKRWCYSTHGKVVDVSVGPHFLEFPAPGSEIKREDFEQRRELGMNKRGTLGQQPG